MTIQTKLDDTSTVLNRLARADFSAPQSAAQEHESPAVKLDVLLKNAVKSPINYPPLDQALFPGDTVAIALQHNLPRPKEILDSLLGILLSLNIEPTDITVVIPGSMAEQLGGDTNEALLSLDSPDSEAQISTLQLEFNSVNCHVHQPDHDNGLRYLIANEAAEPVHLNRFLVDADVVLPVGCLQSTSKEIPDTIFPTFASTEAMQRFGSGDESLAKRVDEIQLVNDTLGAFFTIQLVAGPGDIVQEVYSGVRDQTIAAARDATGRIWALPIEHLHDSIIATIESLPQDQDWNDFADAIINASQLTVDDAPIVIWSEIATKPGRSIRKALQSRFEETISHKLSGRMQHVAAIVAERPVFLRSRLQRATVEDCGLGVIETPDEVIRLTDSCSDKVAIRDAHRVQLQAIEP